ncbi:MAG TPA: hypothetical protein P5026_07575 [Kiritimatiellia bacterium]|nr:hypothetical protein [Kiritimatiellia bacterium]HRU70954.1 hypothetical protein [Kiritimatiellia bacterium]
MDKYTIEIKADEPGYVTARRIRDGKAARLKAAWLKPVGGGEFIPRSRTKQIRMEFLDWE